ncbi:hypothetical protein SBRCBS47491_009202 [Sporothrix bragantina]|uniref:Short chain dehydrogenase n=1 Tax=Sporothrix bragantina TaxID=671064 RepID=A0ABP0CVX4_9PEZI
MAGQPVASAVEIHAEDWDSQCLGFQEAIKQLGRIDYVFAVAGINEQPWLPNLVLVSSGAGFYTIPAMPIYCASKNAIVGFVRSMGKLFNDDKITLNAICPGIVKTAISTSEFHVKAEQKGLLVAPETVVEAFESLLGTSSTTAEAIEVLPGRYSIKPRPEFTNEKSRKSVEMTYERTLQAKAAALAKVTAEAVG